MKAVVLAAGKGTRLYPVTKAIAKPLLPIANRMTLDYAFAHLRDLGVTEAAVVVGPDNADEMRTALGDGTAFGLSLTHVLQPEAKGLAHAVGYAREFVNRDPFVLYLGDAYYDGSFRHHRDRFVTSGAANLNLVMRVPDPSRFGVAEVEGDRIVRLVEKPEVPVSDLAMAGLYFFGPQIWDVLPDLAPSARGEYEITDAIQMLVDRGHLVLAGVHDGAWFDTGTLSSYLQTTKHVLGGQSINHGRVVGAIGPDVVIGAGAEVSCGSIERSVILPGANVNVAGHIKGCLIGGDVVAAELANEIRFGDLK